jgi:hypothetical protein
MAHIKRTLQSLSLQACIDVNLRTLSKRCKPVKILCMLHQAFKHSRVYEAPGIINETLAMRVLLDALTILNLQAPDYPTTSDRLELMCKVHKYALSANLPVEYYQQAHGKRFNGPCDTSIANTLQACTDIGHTRALVETATEGPGNCGNILSGSAILAAFYESRGPQFNEVL